MFRDLGAKSATFGSHSVFGWGLNLSAALNVNLPNGAFGSHTHHWLPQWRSKGTFGWVKVDGLNTQGPDAHHQTQYASGNLVWQLRERLSVGVEVLYGNNQKESGASGHVFRNQVGVAYSLF